MPTILDVNFGREIFGWPESLEKQGQKIRCRNSPSKFAEKFAGNFPKWGTGGILFQEYCFGRENSLSSAANSVSSARNSVSSRLHTNNRLKGTH